MTAAPADDPDAALPRFVRGARVLVAEDNPTNQVITVSLLRKLGLEVDLVANGGEAVGAAATRIYDTVLMDVQMPGVDGIEATRRIRRLPPPYGRVPIIGVTANAFVEDHARCLEAGMQAIVTKPFHAADLSQVMTPHIAHEQGAPAGAARIADPAAWSRLIHDVGADAARAIASVFLQDSRVRLARIAGHLASGDLHAVGREAHALKSSVDLLGFERMARLTVRIQHRTRENAEPAEIAALARDLAAAFTAVEALCRDRLEAG